MFLFSMLLLFIATCAGAWLLLFPAGRDAVGATMQRLGRGLDRRWRSLNEQGAQGARSAGRGSHALADKTWRGLRRHPWLTAASLLLIVVPPLAAVLLGGHVALPGVEGGGHAVNQQVVGLLRGERLVAPPPLPPAVFTTAEVTLVRPMLAGANRNWELLDVDFSQRLLLVFKIMREQHGYDMVLLEGYRSPERQNQLADAGSNVTNARAFQSYHQFGLAGDCAFLRDGKLVISERDPWAMRGYQLYGQVAEAAGLTWGGRWKLMDFGHAELRSRRQ